ncbi:hypothetical protein A3C57_01175 [Candidatus Nomurabacteria bacterium RIFCSPHIGHO2_02_FULL_33_12]|uniref:Uncharacterized protein n=1 Tax=Candidatus Nomurabacteria bacterium RIFCSPLOWO2_01_FULL_33_17 TaxID=1801764 RepID=A0A1F6WQQ9_9BACT|nr:MAG: hypothetical protein A3C57_01175 [Candidatus Nomurabacteria bacterium RIFCSPHIGHO2_02_FULL_33_12]OGI84229.1 MAG: hypothetical protein A2903_00775 [Candidatus Nomurabacteria bacterium RIFCSPLOWO2_01_FULL_33_17]
MQFLIHYLIGLVLGFILEFIYRSVESKRFIKPLFINLQMYGFSTAFLYFLSLFNLPIYFLILFILIFTTGIEFVIGYIYLKYNNIMLWDYSREYLNYKGLICLKFSIAWVILSLIYYYFIMPIFL